jgi:hypothetical protein
MAFQIRNPCSNHVRCTLANNEGIPQSQWSHFMRDEFRIAQRVSKSRMLFVTCSEIYSVRMPAAARSLFLIPDSLPSSSRESGTLPAILRLTKTLLRKATAAITTTNKGRYTRNHISAETGSHLEAAPASAVELSISLVKSPITLFLCV